MRTTFRALLCVLTVMFGWSMFGWSSPAAASPGGLPSADRMRPALLTAGELPAGLTAAGTGEDRGDRDFSAGDRCGDRPVPDNEVVSVHTEFLSSDDGDDGDEGDDGAKGDKGSNGADARGPGAVSLQMMIGATGARQALAVVAAIADQVERCPGTAEMTRWPLPPFGAASIGVVFGGSAEPGGLRGAVIAEGDVLAYITATGLGEREMARIVEVGAAKLARHFGAVR